MHSITLFRFVVALSNAPEVQWMQQQVIYTEILLIQADPSKLHYLTGLLATTPSCKYSLRNAQRVAPGGGALLHESAALHACKPASPLQANMLILAPLVINESPVACILLNVKV
jgi:hypothetical protein